MKIENVDDVRRLISYRDKYLYILDRNERWWKSGHFAFVEHRGDAPDSIHLPFDKEIQDKLMQVIRDEVANIEEKLKQL